MAEQILMVVAAQTTDQTGNQQQFPIRPGKRGLLLSLYVTIGASPALRLQCLGDYDLYGSSSYTWAQASADHTAAAPSWRRLLIHPDCQTAPSGVDDLIKSPVPDIWTPKVVHNNANAMTYNVIAQEIE